MLERQHYEGTWSEPELQKIPAVVRAAADLAHVAAGSVQDTAGQDTQLLTCLCCFYSLLGELLSVYCSNTPKRPNVSWEHLPGIPLNPIVPFHFYSQLEHLTTGYLAYALCSLASPKLETAVQFPVNIPSIFLNLPAFFPLFFGSPHPSLFLFLPPLLIFSPVVSSPTLPI